MDDKLIHDLAVVYAQMKLQNYQAELKESGQGSFSGDSDELYNFLKAYHFALDNIDVLWDEIG